MGVGVRGGSTSTGGVGGVGSGTEVVDHHCVHNPKYLTKCARSDMVKGVQSHSNVYIHIFGNGSPGHSST
jgi:hypothetical protein